MNLTDLSSVSQCKCVVPEAVIPLAWRFIMILSLVFTALVYVSFVLERKKTPKAEEILGFLRKAETFRFVRILVALGAFASILVQPFTDLLWGMVQMGFILLLIWMVFGEMGPVSREETP